MRIKIIDGEDELERAFPVTIAIENCGEDEDESIQFNFTRTGLVVDYIGAEGRVEGTLSEAYDVIKDHTHSNDKEDKS